MVVGIGQCGGGRGQWAVASGSENWGMESR